MVVFIFRVEWDAFCPSSLVHSPLLNALCCSPFIRSPHVLPLFIWKSNAYCVQSSHIIISTSSDKLNEASVVVMNNLLSMCGIMFIITQIQRQK